MYLLRKNLNKKEGRISRMKSKELPFISVCTPTFNRRPFIPYMIQCFQHQTYPKDKIEWIIVDDGTDKIEDLVQGIPQVRYFKYDEKMFLGKKRNTMHDQCKGDIIVYMDDDDYYPPTRFAHAVETLQKNPYALCAGSSEMYIYFKHIHKMMQFGPYNPNHATAATFAFRKELLTLTRYDDTAALAEERHFLKEYTVPFVQMDPLKTILVFSHIHNSFDKKTLLGNPNDPFVKETTRLVEDFVKEPGLKQFYMEDVDTILQAYEPGKPENKPDVLQQIVELKEKRDKIIQGQLMAQLQHFEMKLNEQHATIQQLIAENNAYREKTKYLEEKITKLIQERIQERYKKKNELKGSPSTIHI